jgi:hypothetical protein
MAYPTSAKEGENCGKIADLVKFIGYKTAPPDLLKR